MYLLAKLARLLIQCMKKVFLFIALLFFALPSNSQVHSENGGLNTSSFRMGVTGSIEVNLAPERFALANGTGYETTYDHFNYSVGPLLEYRLSGLFFLTLGLTYSNKSFTGTYYCDYCDFGSPSLPEKVKLKYLEIPITGRYYFDFKKIRPFGEIGLVNQLVIDAENSNPQNRSDASTLNGHYFMAGKLGVGGEIRASPTLSVQLGVAYIQGFINLEKRSDYNTKTLGVKIAVLKAL